MTDELGRPGNEPAINPEEKTPMSRRDALKGLAAAAAASAAVVACGKETADAAKAPPAGTAAPAGAAAPAGTAGPGATPAAGLPQNPYGGKPNTGITLPPYYRHTPSVANANTFFPGTEELGDDEMRISFVGSSPVPPTRAQAATSIMVELGNGKRFFFDLGPG